MLSDDTLQSLAERAGKAAMENAGVSPEDIDCVLVSTVQAETMSPALACDIQPALGLKCMGMDINGGCTGFIAALAVAEGLITSGRARKLLVLSAEALSRFADWTDRSTCVLFGDGAGAVVIGETPDSGPDAHTVLWADGKGAGFISRDGGARLPHQAGTIPIPFLVLQGHDVFAFAVRSLAKVTNQLCEMLGTTPDKLDRVFAHQANGRIIEAVARRMKLPLEKFYLNLVSTGNTSAASIPISLAEAVRKGELKDGMNIVLCGFGAGLTYAGTYMQWPYL